MIKSSTVIKRMISKNWKPVLAIVAGISAVSLISIGAGRYLDLDPNIVYWGLMAIVFFSAGIKWSYDWNKSAIEMEQKQMLRDIEKKHL
jgi:3-phosphoglycerate kinase